MSEYTKRRILEAAQQVFADLGYAEATHADIAFVAGLGRTTFYDYYASKEELLIEMVETRLPQIGAELVEALPDGLDTAERFSTLAARMLEFLATDPLGLVLHTEVPKLDPVVQARIAAAHGELSTEFASLYMQGVREGVFRDFDISLAMRLVYEVIMTGGRWLKDREDPKQAVHDAVDSTVAFLMAGLSAG